MALTNREKMIIWSSVIIVLFFLSTMALFTIAEDQIMFRTVNQSITPSTQQTPAGEITSNDILVQTFTFNGERLYAISILTATYNRVNDGTLFVTFIDQGTKKIIFEHSINVNEIPNNDYLVINIPEGIIIENYTNLAFELTSDCVSGKAVTVWQKPALMGEEPMTANGIAQNSTLLYNLSGNRDSLLGRYYLAAVLGIGILAILYSLNAIYVERKGKVTKLLYFVDILSRYGFLIQQLVSRDFKSKYKRSVLGVLWSFLNPLMVMAVQFVVFSTLFKSNITNFPVYLLTGIVFFSFFSEATSMSLVSIVGNSNLITKVYMPKYIYPVSRVISSSINLMLSLIPLFIVVIATGTRFTPAFILFPYGVICLIVFCIGLGMALSASMVFFRDTQFLWNVISMLWMYATPIFYPESIIPERYYFIIKYNPLYSFIRFSRTIILTGTSPEIHEYLTAGLFAVMMLLFGATVFKHSQDRFMIHI